MSVHCVCTKLAVIAIRHQNSLTAKMIALLLLSAFILSASFPLISFALSFSFSLLLSVSFYIFNARVSLQVRLSAEKKTKPTFPSLFLIFSIDLQSQFLHYFISLNALQSHSNSLIYLPSPQPSNECDVYAILSSFKNVKLRFRKI